MPDDDKLIQFDPSPITKLVVGYLGDFGGDISSLRRTYTILGNKKQWRRDELDSFKKRLDETGRYFDMNADALAEEAGVEIP